MMQTTVMTYAQNKNCCTGDLVMEVYQHEQHGNVRKKVAMDIYQPEACKILAHGKRLHRQRWHRRKWSVNIVLAM
jgi:hypothetical protein